MVFNKNRLFAIGRWSAALLLLIVIFLLTQAPLARTEDAGFALSFDGATEYVLLDNTGTVMQGSSWTTAKTISAWIKPEGAASPVTHPSSGALIIGNDRPRLFGITRALYNGADRIWVWNADSNGTDVVGVEFTPGEWLQVTLVHADGLLSVYKNGQFAGSVPSDDTFLPGGDGFLYIGGNGRVTPTQYFNGQIDEVRLWNVALDAAAIQTWTYQSVNDTHPQWQNLMAYYQMSDGGAVLLSDNSANSNSGLLSGGMDQTNWVPSGAFLLPGTPTPTAVSGSHTPTPTLPPTSTPTQTPLPPTPTVTLTAEPGTVTPTNTAVPPTPPSGTDYALSFDGNNDFVRLAETANIMAPGWENSKTVSLWVKPSGVSTCTAATPSHCDAIFGDRARWWGISRGTVNGQDRLWLWNYDGSYDMIGIPYDLDEWTHIALVHAEGNLLAYKNGILVGSTPSGATLQPNTGAQPILHIGGIINNVERNWTFAGQIDEVQIWNIARSQADILQDMSQPLTGSEAGLAAYYQMSDGAGLSLTDNSGHGWTGALFDGAQGVPPDGQPPQWASPGIFGGPPLPTSTAVPTTPVHTATPTFTPSAMPTGPSATPTAPSATPTIPTATAVPPTPTPGAGENHALNFDGMSHYMRLGTTADVMGGDWTNVKTISAWVRPEAGGSPATHPSAGLLIAGNDRPRTFGITRATYDGADRLWVWNSDANGVDMVGIAFTPGEWIHVALVHSGNTLYAYRNGLLVDSTPSSQTYSPGNPGTLYAGGTGRGQYLAGQVDEIRIWNAALDAAALQTWMHLELDPTHPNWANLLAYYRMNEGAGTAVGDGSSHNHNATLHGGMDDASWVPGPW